MLEADINAVFTLIQNRLTTCPIRTNYRSLNSNINTYPYQKSIVIIYFKYSVIYTVGERDAKTLFLSLCIV